MREMPQCLRRGAELPGDRRLRVAPGRFFDADEAARAAPVCVLGEAARSSLFGADEAIGEYVKVNEQWFRVIGVAGGRR